MPAHVRAEAARKPVDVSTAMPKQCAALAKEAQGDCRARLLITALRRSELRKNRALRDAVGTYRDAEKQYGEGAK